MENITASYEQFVNNPSIKEYSISNSRATLFVDPTSDNLSSEDCFNGVSSTAPSAGPFFHFYSKDVLRHSFYIVTVSRLLELPQLAIAVAQMIFLRDVVMGAVLLASKLTENIRRVRDVVNSTHFMAAMDHLSQGPQKPSLPLSIPVLENYDTLILQYVGTEYFEWRDRATFSEAVILREIGFQLDIHLPYGLLINYAKMLEIIHMRVVMSKALGYLNDSFHTPVHLVFQPNIIACTSILLACRDACHPLPCSWSMLFDADTLLIECASRIILHFYAEVRK